MKKLRMLNISNIFIKSWGKTCCIGLFFLFHLSLKSKAQEYQFIAKIDTLAKIVSVDNFGNLFVVTPENEVLKFNAQGKFLWNYTNNNFGEITQLDVTDPLRVILFYAAFQQIIVLNNNLSEISKYSFNQNPEAQVTLVSSANNNGFWVYDQINRELKKLSNSFLDDLRSGNIYQRNGFDMKADFIITDEQHVYVNDEKEGIRIFDHYGNFIKTALVNAPNGFEVNGDEICFFTEDKLMSYNYFSFQLQEIKLPTKGHFSNAILRFNRLVVLNEKGLTLWAVKKK
jgi:hypothetical protein